MRDDTGRESDRMADLMQVITELTNDCFFTAWTGEEHAIGRQRVEGAKESQALDEFTDEGIHGDHTFGFELAEGHMNGPLIGASGAKASAGQIDTLADAHAGVANQQKGVAPQIVALEELLLKDLILLCGEGSSKSPRETGNVLAADQLSELRSKRSSNAPVQVAEVRAEVKA